MAEGTRAPWPSALGAPSPADTVPPVSQSQPATPRDADVSSAVTMAPPRPAAERPSEVVIRATPPLSVEGDCLRSALEASQLADSGISELSRMARELTGGVQGAKLANDRLQGELSTLRTMLGSVGDHELLLSGRISELERALADAKSEAEQDRRFLTEQHDEFLSALIEEHELALRRNTETLSPGDSEVARRELADAEQARQRAEDDLASIQSELVSALARLEEAQARAERHRRERDELRAEASQLRAQLGATRLASTAPSPAPARPPSYHPPPALLLDTCEMEQTLPARPVTRPPSSAPSQPARRAAPPPPQTPAAAPPAPPTAPVFGPRPSREPPSPEDARPSVISAAALPPGQPSLPPLRPKPDPSTRPLIDYSLVGDGVLPETLEGARIPSKPPRK